MIYMQCSVKGRLQKAPVSDVTKAMSERKMTGYSTSGLSGKSKMMSVTSGIA